MSLTTPVNAPRIAAVVPLIDPVLPLAEELYAPQDLDPAKTEAFVRRTEPVHLKRIDDPANPLIKTLPDGSKTLYLLWGHPQNLVDPNFLVSMVCPLEKDEHGEDMYKPNVLIRGPLANVIIVGGMGCCGAALQSHWTQVLSDGTAIDDARLPLAGLSHPEHGRWLKGKVHIPNAQGLSALQHMAYDVLAHRMPDDKRFKHDCHSHGDYQAYGAQAQHYTII